MTKQEIIKDTLAKLKSKGLLNEKAIKNHLNEAKIDPLAVPGMQAFLRKFLKGRLKDLVSVLESAGYVAKKPLNAKAISLMLKTSLEGDEIDWDSNGNDSEMDLYESGVADKLVAAGFFEQTDESDEEGDNY